MVDLRAGVAIGGDLPADFCRSCGRHWRGRGKETDGPPHGHRWQATAISLRVSQESFPMPPNYPQCRRGGAGRGRAGLHQVLAGCVGGPTRGVRGACGVSWPARGGATFGFSAAFREFLGVSGSGDGVPAPDLAFGQGACIVF